MGCESGRGEWEAKKDERVQRVRAFGSHASQLPESSPPRSNASVYLPLQDLAEHIGAIDYEGNPHTGTHASMNGDN